MSLFDCEKFTLHALCKFLVNFVVEKRINTKHAKLLNKTSLYSGMYFLMGLVISPGTYHDVNDHILLNTKYIILFHQTLFQP